WEKPQVKTVLKQPAVSVRETETGLEWAFSSAFGVHESQRYGQRSDETLGNATTGPTTSSTTSTTTATSSNEDAVDSDQSCPQAHGAKANRSDKAARIAVAS